MALNMLRSSLLGCARANFRPNQCIQARGLITLPIEWKRPERQSYWHPAKTGDGTPTMVVDMERVPIYVESSKEYEKANDLVKRLFTFHFLGRRYAMKRAREEMIESVRNHEYDKVSTEVQIAAKTARIRNLMEHVFHRKVRDRRASARLNNCILKRRKRLRLLRRYDYKRFEWVLEKLDLYYTPDPEVKEYVERKKSIRRLTDVYCDNYRQEKLDEYRTQLDNQKSDFLREKVETLRWIRQEEIECGRTPSVDEEQIQAAVDQLENHLKKLSMKPVVKDESANILPQA